MNVQKATKLNNEKEDKKENKGLKKDEGDKGLEEDKGDKENLSGNNRVKYILIND